MLRKRYVRECVYFCSFALHQFLLLTLNTYDKEGNVMNLTRFGATGTTTFGIIDNLSMNCSGNQLVKAEDSGGAVSLSSSMDFKNRAHSPVEYYYDANGNLTKD
jgi:hypothetical protein